MSMPTENEQREWVSAFLGVADRSYSEALTVSVCLYGCVCFDSHNLIFQRLNVLIAQQILPFRRLIAIQNLAVVEEGAIKDKMPFFPIIGGGGGVQSKHENSGRFFSKRQNPVDGCYKRRPPRRPR